MEAQHAPGPWRLVSDFKCGNGDLVPGIKSDSADCAVAWVHGRNDAESYANGRMITATPDLLDSCRDLVAELKAALEKVLVSDADKPFADVMREIRQNPAIVKANAAIAKATGVST